MLEELATGVRTGSINPVDLVNESLRRISEASHLNAVVAVYAEEALELAQHHNRKGLLVSLFL
jgi:aspartyl-tRNA(Asn)/glutamyl-tRNA(Gln) amidotransferase subunit A